MTVDTIFLQTEMITFGSVTSWIVILGVLVGLSARTLLPYWDKLKSGEIDVFDRKFLGTAVIAFIASIVPAFAFFPVAMQQIGPYLGSFGIPTIFVISALMAYGTNDVINYGLKQSQKAGADATLERRISVLVEKKIEPVVEKRLDTIIDRQLGGIVEDKVTKELDRRLTGSGPGSG